MQAENDTLRYTGHEPLANQYLLALSRQQLVELAKTVGVSDDYFYARARALQLERFRAQQGLMRESAK